MVGAVLAPVKKKVHARPRTAPTPVKGWPSLERPVIQLPPLSSPRSGPPQRIVWSLKGQPRSCGIYPSEGGYRKSVTSTEIDGYRPRLTPGNLIKNHSQRPVIHRPHDLPRRLGISDLGHQPLKGGVRISTQVGIIRLFNRR